MNFPKLYEIEGLLSGIEATLILRFANGKTKHTKHYLLTIQERNAVVLNIFATGINEFYIYLSALPRKGGLK